MVPPHSPRKTKTTRAGGSGRALLDALDPTEAKTLLSGLLDAHPELVSQAAQLADAQLGAVRAEGVAEDVACALEDLRVEDIWDRSGTRSDGEYVDPTEAAWDVVEEAVAPFFEDLARRVALGRRGEVTAVCQGMLLGLYRNSQKEGEFLEGHSPDSLEAVAARAVETWKKRGTGKASARIRAEEWTAMGRFVSDSLPEWWPFLTRILGRKPSASRKQRRRR